MREARKLFDEDNVVKSDALFSIDPNGFEVEVVEEETEVDSESPKTVCLAITMASR
ncbi:MAG: hypothetical protein ACI97A_002059 [Planctomycetota bacterium]